MYIQAIATYIVVVDIMQANLIIVVSAYSTCSFGTRVYFRNKLMDAIRVH